MYCWAHCGRPGALTQGAGIAAVPAAWVVEKLVTSKTSDLFAKIPHGTGQTLLREALLLADHNAYHLGQLVLLRRLLGAWKD